MRQALRQQLERARLLRQARAAALRPYEARRGIHGPRRFRTLFGAQGWVDANWSYSEDGALAVITETPSGRRWQRTRRGWQRADGPEDAAGEDESTMPLDPETAPYWMRPL